MGQRATGASCRPDSRTPADLRAATPAKQLPCQPNNGILWSSHRSAYQRTNRDGHCLLRDRTQRKKHGDRRPRVAREPGNVNGVQTSLRFIADLLELTLTPWPFCPDAESRVTTGRNTR